MLGWSQIRDIGGVDGEIVDKVIIGRHFHCPEASLEVSVQDRNSRRISETDE
jgi:hypothetical protein